jgi:hypothetical protein
MEGKKPMEGPGVIGILAGAFHPRCTVKHFELIVL